MSTHSRNRRPAWIDIFLALIVMMAMTVSVKGFAASDDVAQAEQRSSTTLHIRKGGRENRESGLTTTDTYSSLEKSGARTKPSNESKPGSVNTLSQSASFDFWIYEADVILFGDDDRDGHFHGIDLLIDADTIYGDADVYAAVYLSLEGGPWNEYAVTEDFTIFGASGDDEYVLVTELMTGYPKGSYDLLIELFDAWDGSFVASFGPEDTSELAYLPLEDFDRDEPIPRTVVIVDQGGGGAAGFCLLLPMLFAVARRRLA